MSRLLVAGVAQAIVQLVVFPPKNFMHYLQIYWPSFATKMKLLKFSFYPAPFIPLFVLALRFSSFCWTGKQSNNCFFAVHSPVGFYACRKLRCKRCYNNNNENNNENNNNYIVFRLFSFCSTWTATINWNYSLKIAPYFDAVQRKLSVQGEREGHIFN